MTRHWHIRVRDPYEGNPRSFREWGALCTSESAARMECDIENEKVPSRQAQIVACDKDCFGTRA